MKTVQELMNLVKDFCRIREWEKFHNPKDLAIGLSTEANELLELFRFKTNTQMAEMMENPEKRKSIEGELADVLFFLLRFSEMYGFDMEQCLIDKIKKNNERYPVSKVKGKNLKYNEL